MESRDTTPTPRGSLRRTPQHVLSSFLQTVTTSWFYIPATSGFRPTLADLGVLQSAENNAHGTYSTDTELIFKNQRVDGLRLCSNEKQELHGPAEACFTGARIQTCSGHVLSRLSVQQPGEVTGAPTSQRALSRTSCDVMEPGPASRH